MRPIFAASESLAGKEGPIADRRGTQIFRRSVLHRYHSQDRVSDGSGYRREPQPAQVHQADGVCGRRPRARLFAGWREQAFFFSHSGHFAEVAEVSVDANKKLIVHKVAVAADIGPVMNMSGAETQAQGSVIDGLSTMAGLEITFEKGCYGQANFHQYPILRMRSAPIVKAHFIQSDFPLTRMGEPALPPLAPAVYYAIFAATGERIRALPLNRSGYSI
jgi:CO/xanthine dehydrogenase Mo-binding subunit